MKLAGINHRLGFGDGSGTDRGRGGFGVAAAGAWCSIIVYFVRSSYNH